MLTQTVKCVEFQKNIFDDNMAFEIQEKRNF